MRKIFNFLAFATTAVILVVWGLAETNPALKVVYFVGATSWGVLAVSEIVQ